ncbi:MAG: PAS domain S-box protein [Desulfobulbaceae bacterium]|nr:PAS domain S-box protein [Desulfobulbaceae bacterium]
MTNLSAVNHPSEAEDLLQYRDLFRQAPIGILRTAIDGRILIANQAFAEMLGYNSLEEFATLTDRKVTNLYEDPLSRKRLLENMTAQEPDDPMHFESRWRRKDDTVFPCRFHVRPFVDYSGDIQYFEGFAEDISEQKLPVYVTHSM